jgi:hypothetical protein
VVATAIAKYVQQDIFVHLELRLAICMIIARPVIIAQAAVAANAPMTLCALVEKWMK